jgi:predicted ATPase
MVFSRPSWKVIVVYIGSAIKEDGIKVRIDKFYALNHVEFDLKQGINVIAGKNGSGKSQLLMAIAHQYGNGTLQNEGFERYFDKSVILDPKPQKVLWRPAIRKINEGRKGEKYANLSPFSYLSGHNEINYGYSYGVDERFQRLHDTITNLYIAGNMNNSTLEDTSVWKSLTSSFYNVFGKEIGGEYKKEGGRVGLKLSSGLSSFHTLSTGELEFLSLLCDLLTEKEVDFFLIDEIDAHFHPDLQKRLISEINNIIKNKILLLTTHSPSLMLSVNPENLFYLRKSEEVSPTDNQVTCLVEDFRLMKSISEMYAGFVDDLRFASHYFQAANYEILKYASECLNDSEVFGKEKIKDSEPQTTFLRAFLLSLQDKENVTIADVGVGKGRLLEAFNKIDDRQLSKIKYLGIDYKAANLDELNTYAEKIGIKSKFQSFRTSTKINEIDEYNLCILANVIHEVGPDNLMMLFNDLFLSSCNNSRILILEALELAVGEKRFVVIDNEALDILFERNIKAGNLHVSNARPVSYAGIPLLEYTISILNQPIPLELQDIIKGLEKIIAITVNELSKNLKDNSTLTSKRLAFKCHNLANAEAFLNLLKQEETTRSIPKTPD